MLAVFSVFSELYGLRSAQEDGGTGYAAASPPTGYCRFPPAFRQPMAWLDTPAT